jgi:hypothetical protein
MKTVDKLRSTLLLNIVLRVVTMEGNRIKILKTVNTLGYNSMKNLV